MFSIKIAVSSYLTVVNLNKKYYNCKLQLQFVNVVNSNKKYWYCNCNYFQNSY